MSASGQHNVDIDALLDLTEYEGLPNYQSPSLSPTGHSKATFASPVNAPVPTPSISSTTTTQSLSGPSHNYEMYRQQTGFVPGALTNTMSVNQTNNTGYQDFGSLEYLSSMNPENDIFDFNTSPSQATMAASEMDMDFESPVHSQNFFSTVNPSSIEQDQSPTTAGPAPVGRLWPGAHSQAAMAKAQAQQRQQQQMMQQQQAQRRGPSPTQKARGKAPQPTDPIVEQKITQLLNSMRAKPSSPGSQNSATMVNLPRSRKEEEEMDEDERLLASEEGKKLSSKERRQLRNKVSARAFRSRRKEYITQLEAEIATKVNENGEIRAANRALTDENKRLTDLTRMLLSSPSFSNFLDQLSANPQATAPQVKVEPQQQQHEQLQMPKDSNPYDGSSGQQQIGMAMIPEQNMDFSMLTLDGSYHYQPQVFIVDTPEIPAPIDTAILSGKSTNLVELTFESDDEKVEVPVIERLSEESKALEPMEAAPVDEDFESNPEFALYHNTPATSTQQVRQELDTDSFRDVEIFGGIEPEKMLARYEFVNGTQEEVSAVLAMSRIQRISANVETIVSRLEHLTMDL